MHEVMGPCTILRVQSWAIPSELPNVSRVFGAPWPVDVGSISNAEGEVFCLGPTEWLFLAADSAQAGVWAKRLGDVLGDTGYRVTNVSQALARFRISGAASRELLSKGTGLDLDVAAFQPERCARTRFADVPVVVCCRELNVFELFVTASFKDYLARWLDDAAGEYVHRVLRTSNFTA